MEDLEGFHNYLRLTLLLNEGTRILQQNFRDKYRQLNGGKEWVDSPEFGQNFSETLGKKYFSQAQKIQRSLIKKGNVGDWDIPMLCNILDTPDFGTSPDRKKTLMELRTIRNKHAHLADLKSSPSVSKSEFPVLWTKLSGIIASLGGDKSYIDTIKTAKEISGVTFDHPGSKAVLSPENQERLRKLKEEGSSAVNRGDWDVAIGKYTVALNLFGLSDVERGNLLSNRSLARLKLYTEKKAENGMTDDKELSLLSDGALEDARKVIELRPNWWKGYARVGFVFHAKEEWNSGMVLLNRALALSPGQTEVINVRDECRYEAHNDRIQQHLDPLTMPSGRQEALDKITRTTGPKPDADALIKMNKEFMKSKSPELRASAAVFFAHHHLNRIDVPLDYKMAMQLFAKGAAGGNAEGIYNLGLMYQRGLGVAKDLTRAVELYEEAAAKPPREKFTGLWDCGVSAAEYALGQAYENGFGKPIDFKKAVEWYQKSSGHGVSNADNNLAIMYREGRGVKQSTTKAIQYWELAADRGNVLAMESLAWEFLREGDADKAEIWFKRALDGENMNAVLNKGKFDEALKSVRESPRVKMKDMPPDFRAMAMMSLMNQFEAFKGPMSRDFLNLPHHESSSDDDDSDDDPPNEKSRSSEFIQAQLTNPKRLNIVLIHREAISRHCQMYRNKDKNLVPNTSAPFLQQKAPEKLSALKDITLDQMDPTKDHVYAGHVISLTIMEDSIMNHWTSVHAIVRDENFNFQRCYFYNFKKADRSKKFLYGTKISVMNPYFRLTADLGQGIRIDDPKSVIFHGTDETLCRFCGTSGATDRCSRCKRAFYCSKTCQTEDWKLLKHKNVCDPQLLVIL